MYSNITEYLLELKYSYYTSDKLLPSTRKCSLCPCGVNWRGGGGGGGVICYLRHLYVYKLNHTF